MVNPLQPAHRLLLKKEEKRIRKLDVLADVKPKHDSAVLGASLEIVHREALVGKGLVDDVGHPYGAYQTKHT